MPMDLNLPSPPYRYSEDGQHERNWRADLQSHWSPDSVRKQFGIERTNNLSPRSPGKPPRAVKLVLPQSRVIGKEVTAAAQAGESSPEVLTPRKTLARLAKFRERQSEIGSDLSEH